MTRRFGLLLLLGVLTCANDAQAATVAVGENTSCSIDAAGALSCWGGDGNGGLLGRGVNVSPSSTADPGLVAGMGSGVTDVMLTGTGGAGTTGCAVQSGAAFCWGRNTGLYGNGTTAAGLGPVAVSGLGSGVTKIAVATGKVCAVQNGGAKCWGTNGLGDGTNDDRLTPVVPQYRPNFVDPAVEPDNPVGTPLTSGVTDVAPGWRHLCVIWSGQVLCGVGNTHGAAGFAGDDNFRNKSGLFLRPLSQPFATTPVRIVAGTDSNCALLADGSVWCWGSNGDGRLGQGSTTADGDDDPVQVVGLDSGVTDVAGNASTYCAVKLGRVLCWGDGHNGKLGNGTNVASGVPVEVTGLGGVTSVAVSNLHACAMNSGFPWCWGNNGHYQLGNDQGSSTVPVQVRGSTPKPPVTPPAPSVPKAPVTNTPPRVTTPRPLVATITARPLARLSRTRTATIATILCPTSATSSCRLTAPRTVKHRIKRKTFTTRILGAGTIQRGRRASLRAQLTRAARRRLGRSTVTLKVPITTVVNGVSRKSTVTARITGRG